MYSYVHLDHQEIHQSLFIDAFFVVTSPLPSLQLIPSSSLQNKQKNLFYFTSTLLDSVSIDKETLFCIVIQFS
jgi:hypothetical protein